MAEHFTDALAEAVRERGNPVLVGLDPRWDLLPTPLTQGRLGDLADRADAYRQFCLEVIDVVAPRVPAVKPQVAFFEELGPSGMEALRDVINYARQQGLLVIADAKRNDIGSTAEGYARGWLGRGKSVWGADGLTVSPYLGEDSLMPFVNVALQRAAGIFVLVKTSNPGGALLQDLIADDRPVYRHTAELVDRLAAETRGQCGYGIVGAVAGATYPEQLSELREAMPHSWLLVPGYGAQGGGAADVAGAFDQDGLGAVINNARGIIFAHRQEAYRDRFGDAQWQRAVEGATETMISELADAAPAAAKS